MRIEDNPIPRSMKQELFELLPTLPVQTKRIATDAAKKENVRAIIREIHKEDPTKKYKTSIVDEEIYIWRVK